MHHPSSSTGADAFAVRETWFSEFDDAHRAEATHPGFKLNDYTREGRRWTDSVISQRLSVHVKKVDDGEKSTFLYSEWVVNCGSRKLRARSIDSIPE